GHAYYRMVSRFVAARKFAVRHHKAGLLPALRALRARRDGPMPNYRKHPSGAYRESWQEGVAELLAENFAKAAGPNALGIEGLARGAFEQSRAEVERMLVQWYQQDLIKWAQESGFEAGRRGGR